MDTNSPEDDSQWFCHVCQRTVVPLMTPAPTCPTCNEGFLEQVTSTPLLEPRMSGPFFVGSDDPGGNPMALLSQLFGLSGPGDGSTEPDDAHGGLFGAAEHGEAYGGSRTPAPASDGDGDGGESIPIRNLSDFLQSAFGTPPGTESQPSAQADDRSLAMNPIMRFMQSLGGLQMAGTGTGWQFAFATPGQAAPGDYVFDQNSFDSIVTQLLEQAQGVNGPRPAPPEMIDGLPKVAMSGEVLGMPTITDCAVCKDEFVEADEAAKLPCNHLFHTDCIVPWLKRSGTCPVCRHELVEQPSSHAPPPVPAPTLDTGSTLHDSADASPQNESPRRSMPGGFPRAFAQLFTRPASAPPPDTMPASDDVDDLD